MGHAGYFSNVMTSKRRKKTINWLSNLIKSRMKLHSFDSIAVSGVGGLLIGPGLTERLNKKLIVVRKASDDCHSCNNLEYSGCAQTCIIVDDTVSSGNTAKHMMSLMAAERITCKGIFEYSYKRWRDDEVVGVPLFRNSSRIVYGSKHYFTILSYGPPEIQLKDKEVDTAKEWNIPERIKKMRTLLHTPEGGY